MKHHPLYPLVLLFLTGALRAQPAIVMEPPPLPLRNVLIEVRQDDGESNARERLGADINARVQPDRTEANITLEARASATERSDRARQQVLVLNGRPASIVLGNAMPLRLRQLITQGGVRRVVPGTLWLEAGTGFTATPIWEGGDMIYLELTATQGRQALGPSSRASTTLMLPVGEWITVAESDETLDQQQNALGAGGAGGGAREARGGARHLRVQVRASVR